MNAIITFKTKLRKWSNNNNEYFVMKKGLSRHDVENVRELSSHWGINSDLMPQIICRGIMKAFGKDNMPEYITLDETLPSFISIERGFLSTIRINIDI